MMSAPAVKPALPNAGAQAPKVGSGAPPATTNNPPSSAAGGPKVLPTSGSPNRPIAPANANHAALGTMPLSLVQEHKASSGLNQQPTPQPPQTSALSRTPEKPKEIQAASTLGPKPTSNGVEGSPNRPASAVQPSSETKKLEEASVAAVVNHSTENAPVVAITTAAPVMPTSQPAQHNTPANASHPSPVKPQQQQPAVPATTGSTATNHSTSSVAPSKPEVGKPDGAEAVASSLAGSTAAQAAEPPPPTVPVTASVTSSTSPPVQPVQTPQPAPPPLPSTPPQQQPLPPPPPPSAPTPPPPPPPVQQQQHQAPLPPSQSQQQQQNQPPQQPQEAQSAQQQPPPTTPPQKPQPPQQQQPPPPPQQQTPPPQPPPPQQPQPTQQQQQPAQQQQQQPAQQQASPTQESPAKTPVTTPETKTKADPPPKPEFKVATPPRNSKRKREIKTPAETPKSGASEQDDRKSKRVRTRTQPYQSPLPELTYIAKLKNLMKNPDDKLIVFYKNEFLAVRNAEGSFYICQAMQNIYKSSPRIRIRWLSQEKKDNKPTDVYIPDFYDATDFDCILTNLELKKLDKNKYQLPEEERERTQSILKRALDVEKGVSEKPPVTEEHPDGLDLSLFRDESQLKKRKSLKRTPRKKGKENTSEAEDGWGTEEESEDEPKKKKPKTPKKVDKPKVATKEKVKTKEKAVDNKRAERTSERGRERALSTRRRSEPTTAAATAAASTTTPPTPTAAKNAAVKQPAAKQTSARQAAAKQAATKSPTEKKPKVASKTPKKTEPAVDTSIPTRSTKTRSVKAASQPKTSPVTRTKERDRRGETPAKGRKKPGKKA